MTAGSKCRKVLPFLQGVVLTCLGVYLVIGKPQEKLIRDIIGQQAELLKGRSLYEKVWVDLDVYFRVYLFDVQNPDEVMEGATPVLKEHGPYVYNLNVKKNVLSIDEDADEISFTTTRTYHFNKDLSKGSEDDEITFINSAYIGSIATSRNIYLLASFFNGSGAGSIRVTVIHGMANQFPSFVKKIGNDIEKLFPDMEDLFVRAKAGDILFYGLPMACDPIEYPELKLICGFLLGKKPPGIKDTEVNGLYKWSFFERLNGTAGELMTVNRGVKNKTRLGDTTAFKGKRKQRLWGSDDCNRVMGTDSITWPPMPKTLDYVITFEPQICRWSVAYFLKKVIVNGLIGRQYQVTGKSWQPEEIQCYCPVVSKQPACPTTGVMDITQCQEAPIIYSEPHFLFGDASLREYAKGLTPDDKKHASFITIEPLSGAPLAGSKKLQLNAKLVKTPAVTMLANVTDGYFPILWCEETADSTMEKVADILQAHRFLRLLGYLTYVPLVLGIFLTIKAAYLHDDSESDMDVHTFVPSHSVLIRNATIDGSRRTITRRSRLGVDRGLD